MIEDRIRKRVVVSGRVQGVWFRRWTADRALELGVDGWVRNLEDGNVEAVFEGPASAVDSAVRSVGSGPERARVDEVDVEDRAPEGTHGFSIR